MVCHGELFLLKPHPRYLTHFYLMLAIGGAGGSASVLLFAPMFCSFYQELPIILIGSTLLFLLLRIRNKMGQKPRLWLMPNFISNCIGTAIVCFCSIFVMWHQAMDQRPVFRNAYGVLRLTDQRTSDPRSEQRILYHGGIRHGMQWLHPERRHELSTYYCEHSGVGLALRSLASDTAHKIGLLGLGVGTMAAYGRKGDVYRFYEINQQVIKLARNKFFYLQQSLATIQIVVGDARISLDREKSQQFDFLAVDCFTGDAIPVHLLTREAFKIYFSHLKADGILALHISNRFIDLAPVVARLAHSFGKKAKQISSPESADKTCSEATWILISSHASFSQHNLLKDQAKTIQISPHTPFWTDNYSSLFSIMFQN
jgi:spermidine synthase